MEVQTAWAFRVDRGDGTFGGAAAREVEMQEYTPVKLSARVRIGCSPAKAFAYVSDITTHPEWSPDGIRVVSAPEGPARVGSRYRTVGFSAVRGGEQEADIEVTLLEPPDRFGFVATSGDRAFENLFTFKPDGDGTMVERTLFFDAPTETLERLKEVGAELGRRRDASLQMLKERLETP